MRVLFIHPSDEWYGADQMLFSWARTMAKSGHSVEVIVPADVEYSRELTERLRHIGVEARQVDFPVLRRRYLTPLGLTRLFAKLVATGRSLVRLGSSADLVVYSTSAVLLTALPLRVTRSRKLVHVQEFLGDGVLGWVLSAVSWLTCNQMVCCSTAVKTGIPGRFRSRCVVVPNGLLEDSSTRARSSTTSSEIGLVLVARVQAWKGQLTAIRALGEIASRGSVKARLSIVGCEPPGEEGKYIPGLKEEAESLGVSHQIEWRGQCSPREVEECISESDVIFNLSTRPDPFPLATLEAMRAGGIIVASRLGGLPEMLEGSGYLVDPSSPGEVADAVERIVSEPEEAERRRLAARERWEREYSPEAHSVRLIETIDL